MDRSLLTLLLLLVGCSIGETSTTLPLSLPLSCSLSTPPSLCVNPPPFLSPIYLSVYLSLATLSCFSHSLPSPSFCLSLYLSLPQSLYITPPHSPPFSTCPSTCVSTCLIFFLSRYLFISPWLSAPCPPYSLAICPSLCPLFLTLYPYKIK